jgi:hypothetical protein
VDDSFNDVLTSLRIEAIAPENVVELFQHCNFGGWRVNFPVGNFVRADLESRGGINDDASSIRIKEGFKATLFVDNNFSGRFIVLGAGEHTCFTQFNFNDVLSSLRVEKDDDPGPTPCVPGDEIDPDNPPTPPTTIRDWISNHDANGSIMTRISFDRHIVVYVDDQVDRTAIGWVQPLISRAVRYMKKTYDPDFHYGPDRIFLFLHQGRFGGGTISSYFDAFSNFRNAADGGANNWGLNADNRVARDILTHELCHIVEGSSNGVHESPAFEVWRDSKWAEFFQFDLYKALGEEQDATRVFNRFMATEDNFPAAGTRWFRDWFYPLWLDGGGTCQGGEVMGRFFRLLKVHFPKVPENGGRNLTYARRMNLGEFVHFTSGALGRDLSGRAQAAFRGGFSLAQFNQARATFPGIVY